MIFGDITPPLVHKRRKSKRVEKQLRGNSFSIRKDGNGDVIWPEYVIQPVNNATLVMPRPHSLKLLC